MSNVCCKECSGWFKSFTKIERALAVLEAILLVVLVVLLILLILHLIVCVAPRGSHGIVHNTSIIHHTTNDVHTSQDHSPSNPVTVTGSTKPLSTDHDARCSWTPSAKTEAGTLYYEDTQTNDKITKRPPEMQSESDISGQKTRGTPSRRINSSIEGSTGIPGDLETFMPRRPSDGKDSEDEYKHEVALIKLKPPKDIIFGCILTIVSDRWTLTAASCIEAIEEVDSLDSFTIMKNYGSNERTPPLAVEDVQIHPMYEGTDASFDLAAVKSAGGLTKDSHVAVPLATALDYALTAVGERLTVLGYGPLRSTGGGGASERRLQRAGVSRAGRRQCAGGAALRHLVPGRAAARGAGPARALCAGVVRARGQACGYCGGTPLVRAGRLLGLMAEDRRCGAACEPQLYVLVPDLADWIATTLAELSE